MDRRFVIFLVLVGLVWASFFGLKLAFGPAPEQPVAKVDEPAAEPVEPVEPKEPGEKPARNPTDPVQPPDSVPPKVAPSAAPLKQITLGSLDKTGPYRLLATFTSRGAAVERVELNKFNDVEDQSGYIGHLALTDAPTAGALVNVVGPGTPAALATCSEASGSGLQVGDVIAAANGIKTPNAALLEGWRAKNARPGQAITLTVERAGIAKPLTFTVNPIRRPLEVVRPEPHEYDTDTGKLALPADPLSLLVTLDTIGGKSLKPDQSEFPGLPSLLNSSWTLDEQGSDFVQFSYTLDEAALKAAGRTGSLKLVKRYTVQKADDKLPGYHVNLRLEVHNLASEAQTVAYRLLGPTGLPLEGWWYSIKLHPEMFKGAGARDVVWRAEIGGHQLKGCPAIASESRALLDKDESPEISLLDGDNAQSVHYAGVDTQFFASMVLPQGEGLKFRRLEALPVQNLLEVPKNRLKTLDVSVLLVSDHAKLDPDKPLAHEFQVFFGPKDPEILKDYGLDLVLEYGWTIFKYVAVFLQYVLALLHLATTNYGISIILLTLIVRSCMVPISLKQAKSAAMMQMLAPEMAKIKEKFPDDPMKQNAAMQALYKQHNFNPFGGCLLVFFQLPIFIGLYRCLSVDIHLRDAALIPGINWASNLAGPDKLFFWKDHVWSLIGDEAAGYLGPYFNFFPLITIALFLIQQKMFTPPATDEQTRMQQQMMMYMTVFMGVMFYKVPAGLCLYFITSSLWGICERKLLPKPKPLAGGAVAIAAPAKPTSPNGSAKPPGGKKQKRR